MLLFLVLHNIRSLHNVGSMFRTADAAGVKKIYLTGYTPSPYDFFSPPAGGLRKDFAKTALGAEKFVEWEYKRHIAVLLERLKKEKVFILALEQSFKAIPYTNFPEALKHYSVTTLRHSRTIALIVGNEVRGLTPAILKKSDAVIEIPMYGKKESLNVAVAAGVALYELTHLRRKPRL